ncbi:hypothetical protein A616_16680 [Brevibacillus brevis X23]|nr:hypothetical protein A616_16680 [Brevibacillus brevis X23]
MNSFTKTITPKGFTESLVYKGSVYAKRYEKDEFGWTGIDQAWEFEDLPDELIEALNYGDENEIMDALEGQ